MDFELSARTMDKIAAASDIVVPGDDNYFLAVSTEASAVVVRAGEQTS